MKPSQRYAIAMKWRDDEVKKREGEREKESPKSSLQSHNIFDFTRKMLEYVHEIRTVTKVKKE